MRRVLHGIALLAAVASLAGCGGGGEKGSDIAFVSTRDGDYAIFAMAGDGGGQHRLTSHDVDVSSPQALFFQIDPAWSPDGSRIAFSSRRSGTFDIYVMSADGTGTRRLTSGKAVDAHPSFSPDGRRIVFARDSDIYVMAADGTGLRQISGVEAEDGEPAWSPDGKWIAYVRRASGETAKELWLMRPDGSEAHALTTLGGDVLQPAWSPDGSRIAFSTKEASGSFYELRTIGVDGKDVREVVPTASDNFAPSWSPDGERIAYVEDGAVFSVELGGGDAERLTSQDSNDATPVWNPQPPPETDS